MIWVVAPIAYALVLAVIFSLCLAAARGDRMAEEALRRWRDGHG